MRIFYFHLHIIVTSATLKKTGSQCSFLVCVGLFFILNLHDLDAIFALGNSTDFFFVQIYIVKPFSCHECWIFMFALSFCCIFVFQLDCCSSLQSFMYHLHTLYILQTHFFNQLRSEIICSPPTVGFIRYYERYMSFHELPFDQLYFVQVHIDMLISTLFVILSLCAQCVH